MAELCTAFKRIVPRYQFSTNQAAFVFEDMNDSPKQTKSGAMCYKSSTCGHNHQFHNVINRQTYKSAYGISMNPKVCNKYCSNIDSCQNWAFKPF